VHDHFLDMPLIVSNLGIHAFMKTIENFMQDLFQTRIAEQKEILANRAPYRQKFFTPDCRWDSRVGTLEMMETERIVSSDGSDMKATVITAYNVPFYASGPQTHRRRYHIKAVGDNWLVWLVENECLACRGEGDENCINCKGQHWLSSQRGIAS